MSGQGAAEQLSALYLEQCREAVTLSEEIDKSKADIQQLQLRLRACGVQDASLIPKDLRCGGRHAEDPAITNMKSMVVWLAENYDAERTLMFDVGSKVEMGGRPVFLGRMVSWQLSGGQKLSVPEELRDEIGTLLCGARRGIFDQSQLQQLAASWEMIGADIAADGCTRPSVFLVHREREQAIVVAAWPSLTMQPDPVTAFDPEEHFRSILTQDSANSKMGIGNTQAALPAASLTSVARQSRCLPRSRSAGSFSMV